MRILMGMLFWACCIPAAVVAEEKKLDLHGSIGPWRITCEVLRTEAGVSEDCVAIQKIGSPHPGRGITATLRAGQEQESDTLLFSFPDPNVGNEMREAEGVRYRAVTVSVGAAIGDFSFMLPVGPKLCSQGACSSGLKLDARWMARLATADAVRIATEFPDGVYALTPVSLDGFVKAYLTLADPSTRSEFLSQAYAQQLEKK